METVLGLIPNYIEANGYLMFVCQTVIAGLGIPAIFMSQSTNDLVRRCACLVAFAAQPFWFLMAYHTQAWGVFIMSFFYSFAWAKGIWNFWIKPYLQRQGKDKETQRALFRWRVPF